MDLDQADGFLATRNWIGTIFKSQYSLTGVNANFLVAVLKQVINHRKKLFLVQLGPFPYVYSTHIIYNAMKSTRNLLFDIG